MEVHYKWYQSSSIARNSNIKRLNHEQVTDLIDRGLCFSCEDLLTTNHKCQKHSLVMIAEEEMTLECRFSRSNVKEAIQHIDSEFKLTSQAFTKGAWEALLCALEMAECMHQKIETEHLMKAMLEHKAMLEQKQGLVPRIFAEVRIDSTYILNIIEEFIKHQPMDIGESMGSVLGLELKALLQRAMEWKEEYGDFLVSIEHLLLGFNLDNRIGKYVYKEGNAFDIAMNILDAIEVLREPQLLADPAAKHKMVTANTELSWGKSIVAPECEHSWIDLYKWCSGWTNPNSFVNDFMICVGPFVDSGIAPLGMDLYSTFEVINYAQLLFDEMSNRGIFFENATNMRCFKDREFDSALILLAKMKEKNILTWNSLTSFIQRGGLNVVEFFYEKLNANKDMITTRVNLMGVLLKAIDHGWWEHSYLEENGSSYDFVLGTTMASVGAVQVIRETPRKDILGWITTISSDVQFEQGKAAHHYFNHLPHTKIKPNEFTRLAFDPGGSEVAIGTPILEDKDCFKGVECCIPNISEINKELRNIINSN